MVIAQKSDNKTVLKLDVKSLKEYFKKIYDFLESREQVWNK